MKKNYWSDKLHKAQTGESCSKGYRGEVWNDSRNVQVQGEFDEVVWQRLINTYVRGWWSARDDDREREECRGIRNDSWKKTVKNVQGRSCNAQLKIGGCWSRPRERGKKANNLFGKIKRDGTRFETSFRRDVSENIIELSGTPQLFEIHAWNGRDLLFQGHFSSFSLTLCAGDWFADHNEWPTCIQQFAAFFLNSSVFVIILLLWIEIITKK